MDFLIEKINKKRDEQNAAYDRLIGRVWENAELLKGLVSLGFAFTIIGADIIAEKSGTEADALRALALFPEDKKPSLRPPREKFANWSIVNSASWLYIWVNASKECKIEYEDVTVKHIASVSCESIEV